MKIKKRITMQDVIEDSFGEIDLDMLYLPANIAYHVGHRKVTQELTKVDDTSEPYSDWVWIARYSEWEE